jgi:iron-sulfur cluster protein
MKLLPELKEELGILLNNRNLRVALERVISRYVKTREASLSILGDFGDIRKRLVDIKDSAIDEAYSIWDSIANRLEERGTFFTELADAKVAREKILDVLKENGVHLLIKSKSITSEEIGLNLALEAGGIKVVETDLGERILQLMGDKPSHLIVPAIHRTKEEIAELFSKYYNEDIPPDPFVITKKVREEFRSYFLSAKAGFTGINVVSADPTYFYLMTNEGNGRLCATLPDVYITLAGWEKIVRNLSDAIFILKVLPKSAVGIDFSSYVSIFAAPFRWKDGRKWYVFVLDNGRKKAREDRYLRHALRCIRCGACMMVCPVYRVLSGHGFSKIYMGGIGVIWTAITQGLEEAAQLAELCASCGRCNTVCPAAIPISDIIEEIRFRVGSTNLLEKYAPIVVADRRKFSSLGEVRRIVRLEEEGSFLEWAFKRGLLDKSSDTAIYGGCVVEEFLPKVGIQSVILLEKLGFNVAVSGGLCCGLPLRVYGKKGEYLRCAYLLKDKLKRYKEVITICDSCYSTIVDAGFENVKPIYEFLLDSNLVFYAREPYRVALHIPCHTFSAGREGKLIEFMESVLNIELIRSEYERVCCGGAGLYRYKYPSVSRAIFDVRKDFLVEVKPDFIITTCPSCLMKLKDDIKELHLDIEVVHLVDFILNYTNLPL